MRHVFYCTVCVVSGPEGEFLAGRSTGMLCTALPDFNQPDFETMTVTRMLEQVMRIRRCRRGRGAYRVELGGFVPTHAFRHAARAAGKDDERPIDRLVLWRRRSNSAASRSADDRGGLAAWRETNRYDVFHHAEGGPRHRLRDLRRRARYDTARSLVEVRCSSSTAGRTPWSTRHVQRIARCAVGGAAHGDDDTSSARATTSSGGDRVVLRPVRVAGAPSPGRVREALVGGGSRPGMLGADASTPLLCRRRRPGPRRPTDCSNCRRVAFWPRPTDILATPLAPGS